MTETYDPKKLDEYKYVERDATWIQKFLWGCAGADRQLLMQSPHSDRVKEEGIGGVVLATAVLAFFSGGYAFYTIFSNKDPSINVDYAAGAASVIFGLVWSLIIFNLDRFIVSTAGSGDGTDSISWGEFTKALPRLIMALFIGFTLSKPLEVRILEAEIKGEIAKSVKSEVESQEKMELSTFLKNTQDKALTANQINETYIAAKKKLDEANNTIANLNENYRTEVVGGNSRSKGKGPVADALEQQKNAMEATLSKLETDVKQAFAAKQAADQDALKAEEVLRSERKGLSSKVANTTDGLWARIQIAHEKAAVMTWVLSLLFICIEITPVLLKMMLPIGPYNYLKENQKKMALARYGIETNVLEIAPTAAEAAQNGTPGAMGRMHRTLFGQPAKGGVTSHDLTVSAKYHRADTILNYERGQMLVEQELTLQEQKKIAPGAFGKPDPTSL